MELNFKKISIIGLGLIGTSILHAIKAKEEDEVVTFAYDINAEHRDVVLQMKIASFVCYNIQNAVEEADYSETGYHYGNYFAHDTSTVNPEGEGADFLWANFTKSKEMNDKANAAFEAEVREKMFPLFSEFASCGENPDVYHGWTLYDRDDKDFMPTFPAQE